MRALLLTLATAAAAALALPAAASAASLAFVKDSDVWLSAADGSGARALTADGRPGREYWSPSQADDGTIAASQGQQIVLLAPDGRRLRAFDAPMLFSASTGSGGRPRWVAISPDGSRIAYAMTGTGCTEEDAWCRANGKVGVVSSTGAPLALDPPTQVGGVPSWIGNETIAYDRSYVTLWDLASGATDLWFSDGDVTGEILGTLDVEDAELSDDGRRLAAVRGDATKQVQLYDVAGPVSAAAQPAPPTPLCASPPSAAIADPTLTADGGEVFWEQQEGVLAWSLADGCAAAPRVVVPGASQPDWGPAALPPAPARQDGPAQQTGSKKKKKKKKGKRGGRG
ncbi:MAG TPA: hypothetical protein VIL49_09260 [Capillimicrobium sp.]|jgi:hypothetical protein